MSIPSNNAPVRRLEPLNIDVLRQSFQSKSLIERESFLQLLSANELKLFYDNPNLFLFDKQIIPSGDWRYLLLQCGRGFGKTFTGGAEVAKRIKAGAKRIGLCGAKYADVEQDMIPAILSWFPQEFTSKIDYNSSKHILHFPNGAIIKYYSSDTEIRGPNTEFQWNDEICKWCDGIDEKIMECYNNVSMTVRRGNAQILNTSTPKDLAFFRNFQKKIDTSNKFYKMIIGTMFDNPFLSLSYKEAMLEEHGKSRLGRQELYGELLTDVEGALWTNKMIDDDRIDGNTYLDNIRTKRIQIVRTVVANDPAVSDGKDSDETGIVVISMDQNNHIYVVADRSGKHSPYQWAKETIKAYNEFEADRIIAEKNNGGQLVEVNIRAVDNMAPIKLVQASKGKIARAEPVAALYERHKVHHVGYFKELEYQMTHYTGDPKQKSPDRLDALVWAATELLLNKTYTRRDFSNMGSY